MSQFASSVTQAFAPGGALAQVDPSFLPRQGQTEMASAVARCIEDGGHLVVEAGTGVGKTYAYLVPALLSGERVLLSTATKTLQDQLFGRDLPRLMQALGLRLRVALLKGRSSYYCPQRAQAAHHFLEPGQRQAIQVLSKIESWARQTVSGDLAEVPGLDERSPVIGLVTSSKDNCLGSECPQLKSCYVNQARKEAMSADVVVVNHHLFFADLAVRESGVAELLPSCRVVVFDEAHKLNEIGIEFSGLQLSARAVLDMCREALASALAKAKGLAPWNDLVAAVETAMRDMRLLFLDHGLPNGRVGWGFGGPQGIPVAQWGATLQGLNDALQNLYAALELVEQASPELAKIKSRCADLVDLVERFAGPCDDNHVRWAEVGQSLRLSQAPLDIAALLRSQRVPAPIAPASSFVDEWDQAEEGMSEPGAGEGDVLREKSWIYTSATLGDEPTLSWFTGPCGLDDAQVLTVKSPFDYATQAGLYIPERFAKPSEPQHSLQVAQWVADAAQRLGGRTMVLTTTLKALAVIGDALEESLGSSSGLAVLRQGSATKRELIERFRAASHEGRPGCVLVASASFWEGVDIPGQALQLVVIDKLPFPPPNDPLVQALCKRLESQGKKAFQDYYIPEAIVALKQGAGRLIRHENDAGVLVVCDTRLRDMSYGRRVLGALPPMYRLLNEQSLNDYLASLTKFSTKA